MPAPTFTQTCRDIRSLCDLQGLRRSGRQIKHLAGQYLQAYNAAASAISEQCETDNWAHFGQLGYDSLTHHDPTADLALRHWFDEQVRAAQVVH